MNVELGEKLKAIRLAEGLDTLDKAADRLDLSVSYLSELENGKKEFSNNVIKKYLRAFPGRVSADLFYQNH